MLCRQDAKSAKVRIVFDLFLVFDRSIDRFDRLRAGGARGEWSLMNRKFWEMEFDGG